MKEEMKLKEFLEKIVKDSPIKSFDVLKKCIELESIENWLNAMYGVDLEIIVKLADKREGRFYGKSVLEKLVQVPSHYIG
jgi:hypothetical protein